MCPRRRRAPPSSMRGSICSMNGIITRMTNGTVGTRLASTTPDIDAGQPGLVQHRGERNAEGDRRHQQRQQEQQHDEPLAGEIAPRQRVGGGHAEQPGEQHHGADDLEGDDEDVAELELPPGLEIPARRIGRPAARCRASAWRSEFDDDGRDHGEQVDDEEDRPAPRPPSPTACAEVGLAVHRLSLSRRRPGRDRRARARPARPRRWRAAPRP